MKSKTKKPAKSVPAAKRLTKLAKKRQRDRESIAAIRGEPSRTVRIPLVTGRKAPTFQNGTANGTPSRRPEAPGATREAVSPRPAGDRRSTGQLAVPAGVPEAFTEWRERGAKIADLSAKTGVKRSKLRRLFIQLAGGKAAFSGMRANGAGGRSTPPSGSRNGAAIPRVTDEGVPVLKGGTSLRDGWRYSPYAPGRPFELHTAPDGTEYVAAKANERADLIVLHERRGLSPTRLRIFATSPAAKRIKREERVAAKREAAREAATPKAKKTSKRKGGRRA